MLMLFSFNILLEDNALQLQVVHFNYNNYYYNYYISYFHFGRWTCVKMLTAGSHFTDIWSFINHCDWAECEVFIQ